MALKTVAVGDPSAFLTALPPNQGNLEPGLLRKVKRSKVRGRGVRDGVIVVRSMRIHTKVFGP